MKLKKRAPPKLTIAALIRFTAQQPRTIKQICKRFGAHKETVRRVLRDMTPRETGYKFALSSKRDSKRGHEARCYLAVKLERKNASEN